jgi:hypothetical protein
MGTWLSIFIGVIQGIYGNDDEDTAEFSARYDRFVRELRGCGAKRYEACHQKGGITSAFGRTQKARPG